MDNSILTDDKKMVLLFLRQRYIVDDTSFTISEFEAMEGDKYLVKTERKNDDIEFFGKILPVNKYSYILVDNGDYLKWKNIYLRKDKLQKIIKNVKIQ